MNEEEPKQYPVRRRQDDSHRPARLTDLELEVYRIFRGLQPQDGSEEAPSGGRGSVFSLRDILFVFFRHKKKVLAVFLLVFGATFFVLASSQSMYESQAKVLIRGDRTTLSVDPSAEGNSFLRGGRGMGVQTRSEMALIGSATVAERVVDEIGTEGVISAATAPAKEKKPTVAARILWPAEKALSSARWAVDAAAQWCLGALHLTSLPLTPREGAVGTILGHLAVEPSSGGSDVLNLGYQAYAPEAAQRILNALLDAYLAEHILVHKNRLSPEFFKKKTTEAKARLEAKEGELEKRKKDLNIASLSAQKDLLLKEIDSVRSGITTANAEISASEAMVAALEKRIGSLPRSSGAVAPAVDPSSDMEFAQVRDRLIKLRLDEMDMKTKYKDTYKPLADIRKQIAQLEEMLGRKKGIGSAVFRAPVVGGAAPRESLVVQFEFERALLQGQLARQKKLVEEAARLQGDLSSLTSHEQELQTLEREVALLENEYRQYINSLQASEISDALDRSNIGNVSIVQSATRPVSPVRSQRKTLALLGFGTFMGLVLSLGLAFVLEYLDHSVKTVEDVERRLGLRVLVSLPAAKHHRPVVQEEVA